MVLPSASVTELMAGRWMKGVHEDGNTGHGSKLSAGMKTNFGKDEDGPWEPRGLSGNG